MGGSRRANGGVWSRCTPPHEGSAATHEDTDVSNIMPRKASVPFATNCHFWGLKGGFHKVHFYGQDGCCSRLARPPAALAAAA